MKVIISSRAYRNFKQALDNFGGSWKKEAVGLGAVEEAEVRCDSVEVLLLHDILLAGEDTEMEGLRHQQRQN